ncbi:hypothetical protein GKD95_05695 [Faecalibacterium prausnitzii]|uniref:LPXTG cell wall anchor domain-containing protein n=1 Tax=Faecalibacterium prausnitzii TaxID=853 RepID=A0A844DR39_9FIRM|nr:hypothetical protein [Faecalibacterium prausnitzii]MSC62840.1 hypothetical protein [Faecalibacterium prausnitzii]
MTNKKLKMAAMSVALTACVAASPLAANADAPEAAPGELKKEPVAEETKKEENTAEPQDNKQSEKAQETLKDAEVKYNKDNPTTNPDGSQKLDGVIVTNPDSGETGSGETGGTTDPEQKKPEEVVIGTAEKTEKSETNVETKPNPGAEPIVDTTTPPTVEKNPDGSTAITQPTVTPGKETTTTTGSGTATGNLNEKEEEVKEIDLDKELGENPDISWDIKQGDKAVEGKDYTVQEVKNDGNKQTLVLRKEDTKTAEMTAEDIAKLVDAEKPTVNPDGTYTLTRTETILDAEGNPQTRTTYITIQDNKVTTKTTTELTITREKIEHNEEASIPTDVVLPDVKLNNNETLSHTKLDEMLKEKGGKDANGVKDGEYTYKETAEDGTVREYTIKIDTTSTDQLTNKEIVDKLNDKLNSDRYSAEGEDIYYRADNGERVKLDVKQKAALRRNLSIDVSVTETKKDTKTEAPDKETAENEVKDKALREALYKAAGGMTTDEATLAELKKAIDAGTFNRDEGGVFTATVGGKTYSFEYYGAKVETTVTDAVDPTVPGKDPDKITDVKDNTLAGSALVTYGKVSWTDTETGKYHEVTGDAGTVIPTPPEGTEGRYDEQGRLIGFDEVTTDKNGHKVTTTYYITYSTLTDAEKEALAWDALLKEHPGKTKEDLMAEGYKNVRFEGDVTKAEWTVTKKTEGTDVTTEPLNRHLVAEGSVNFNYKFSEDKTTLTVDGVEYTKGADGKYTRTEKVGNKTTTYTVTVNEEELKDDDTIKAMLAKEFHIDASKITLKDGKTATYTDGKTTVTIDYSNLKKNTLTINKSVDESMQTTVDTNDQAALNQAYENFWADILTKYNNRKPGEEIWVGDIQVKANKETKDKVITYLKTSVTHADMTTEQLIKALNDQKKLAQKTYVKVNEGNEYEETLKNYYSGKGDFYHTYAPYGGFLGTAKGDYIGHLDLASGAKLDLLPGEDGKSQTTDCVLVNPKLEWNDSAEHLLADQSKLDKKDRNHDAGLDGKVSYDKSGHYEYDRGDNNHPNASAFYKVTGTVAYDAVKDEKGEVKRFEGKDAEKDAVNAYLKAVESDKTYDTLTEKEKQKILSTYVVKLGSSGSNPNSPKGYQVYKKSSTMTAYGYMTRDANVCANATASKGSLTGWYAGGYDLKISKLVQVRDGQVVGENQSSIKTLFAPVSVRSSSTKTNSSMTVGTKTTSTPVEEWATAGYGTQTDGEYKYDVDREKERSLWQFGYSDGSYKSFTNLIQNIFNGDGTGTVEGGFIKYEYHTEKDKEGNPVQFEADKMVVTTKQDAEVHYTFTSQESRDVWIKGYTQTVVPPVNPGPDSPELPPVEDAKPAPAPAPAPETPVLPVVQDARPDPAPTPAPTPAPAPETPVLPAVQDAKLIQTGTSGWLADLMLGAGMVLSAAGYWMERKRKAMFYKSQH